MPGGTMMIWDLFKKPEQNDAGAPLQDPGLDFQLRGVAQAVLEEWTGLSPAFLGAAPEKPLTGMVCLGAPLLGPRPGLLTLCASHRTGALLATKATGDPGAASFSGEALRELCQQLREQLLNNALGLSSDDYLLHAPGPMSFEHWPKVEPSVSLLLTVEGLPLELRLWLA